jgi:O-antigen/teichoic acid export membrane protein
MATTETSRAIELRGRFPWLSGATWSQIKEYAPTFLTEFSVMASQIIVYKLVAHYLGKLGFSEYALARRTLTLLLPIPVFGLAVGLPRYISFSNGRNDRESADRYFGATLWCVGIATLLCAVLINCFPAAFSYLFFGSRSYRALAFPMSLMILGLCEHTVACGYFRGHMQLDRANLLQFINLGLLPILVIPFVHGSLENVLRSFGSLWVGTSTVALILAPLRAIGEGCGKQIVDLTRYGIQRVPGDFFLMALFTLPATIVAHVYGVEQAGFVAFGISLVSMVGGIFGPVGLVLLPKATWMLAEQAHADLRAHLELIVTITLAGAAVIVSFLWAIMPSVIRMYLGAGFEQVIPIARFLILAALPFSLYLVVRNLVDAYHEYGVTAAILGGGLTVFLIGLWVNKHFALSINTILVDFVSATSVITALSSWECWRILRAQPDAYRAKD